MNKLIENLQTNRHNIIEMLKPEYVNYDLITEEEKINLKLAILNMEIKLSYLNVKFEKYNYD